MGVYDRMSSGERILVTNSPLADQSWHEACDASRFIHSINHLIKETIMTISPQELATRQERGEVSELIDVRTPVEFREVHVAFARNEPLDRLAPTAA